MLGQRSAHRRHDIAEPRLPRPDHVHVPLDYDRDARLADGAGSEVEAEERAALVEDLGLRGIQVLRLFAVKAAATHCNVFAALVGDGDDDAAAEAIVRLPTRL